MDSEVDTLAKILWDYNRLNQQLKPAECILAMGCHDKRVASRSADLLRQNLGNYIVVSGGLAPNTPEEWKGTEAEVFADVIAQSNVPNNKVFIEDQALNTADNFVFSFRLLKDKGMDPPTLILVTKPYMERRALATFKKMYPAKEAQVTSPQFSYQDYPDEEVSKERFINTMVGDTQRVLAYPEKGFSIPQEMPQEVKNAMNRLIELGFSKHTLR